MSLASLKAISTIFCAFGGSAFVGVFKCEDLLIQAETAIHDLLLEIYARDGHLNDRAWQIHRLLVKLKKEKR